MCNFKGELIHAALNYPGSWHDNKLAVQSKLLHPKLQLRTPVGMALLADSAFCKNMMDGKIVRIRKSD